MAKPLWRLRGPGLTISEFSGNGSPVWGECEKCGADTVDDSCGLTGGRTVALGIEAGVKP